MCGRTPWRRICTRGRPWQTLRHPLGNFRTSCSDPLHLAWSVWFCKEGVTGVDGSASSGECSAGFFQQRTGAVMMRLWRAVGADRRAEHVLHSTTMLYVPARQRPSFGSKRCKRESGTAPGDQKQPFQGCRCLTGTAVGDTAFIGRATKVAEPSEEPGILCQAPKASTLESPRRGIPLAH